MRDLYQNDIIRLAKPLTNIRFHCVYFLISENKIVYVGSSSTPYTRISSHLSRFKADSYHIITFSTQEEALKKETHYIKTIKPIHNVKDNPDAVNRISPHRQEANQKKLNKRKEEEDRNDTVILTPYNGKEKINLLNNNYIKKKNLYIFKINNELLCGDIKYSRYMHKDIIYKKPDNLFGEHSKLITKYL